MKIGKLDIGSSDVGEKAGDCQQASVRECPMKGSRKKSRADTIIKHVERVVYWILAHDQILKCDRP